MSPESQQFPIGIEANWQQPNELSIPDPYLKNWLLDTSSLTERLQAHCRDFRLQLLGQRQQALDLEESAFLNAKGQEWRVREVLLYGEGKPWVFAHSVIPNQLCEGDLAGLGNKPLGKILFNDPRFNRQPFQICQLPDSQSLLKHFSIDRSFPLWGRRSVFQFQHLSMLVAEIFLPDAPAYKNRY